MGFLDRFRSRKSSGSPQPELETRPVPHPDGRAEISITVAMQVSELVKITGTTTFAKDAANALATRMGLGEDGYLEADASLEREPDNPADPNAVTVNIQGERIGYVPSYVASSLPLSEEASILARVQLFTAITTKGLRVEGWVWLGGEAPRWEYSAVNRPPMTPEEKRRASAKATDTMIADGLARGGSRAEQFRRGAVGGIHYLQTVEPIKQLKREGRLQEALELCYLAIEGAENDRESREPAPWYTEQAAIIHRKLGQRDQEIAVLERWLAATPADRRNGAIRERLGKLTGDPRSEG